jgi:ribosome-binding protein aMBF1 (putative translation factor)
MSEHTKKHPISAHSHGATLYVNYRHTTYAIPKKVAEKYLVEDAPKKRKKSAPVSLNDVFARLDEKYTKRGALLKGLRLREGLSQVEFAKKIKVTQANLSNMENGRRSIGKNIAKRIEKAFGINYRYFLE